MRRFFLLVVSVLVLTAGKALAQTNFYVEPRLGWGTFRMASMKSFQEHIVSESDVNAKATSAYPAYFQYGVSFIRDLDEQSRWGFFYERGSTGGRIAYKDYSGEIKLDTPLRYNALGALLYSHKPIKNSTFDFVAGVEASVYFTKLKLESYTRIYEESVSEDNEAFANGLALKPFIGLQKVYFRLPVSLTIGYLVNANKHFHGKRNPDSYIPEGNGDDKLQPSWSGVRLNFSVAIPITNNE